jgi:hypothetical protein
MVDVTPESSFGKFWRDGLGTLVSMSTGFLPLLMVGQEHHQRESHGENTKRPDSWAGTLETARWREEDRKGSNHVQVVAYLLALNHSIPLSIASSAYTLEEMTKEVV